MRLINILRNKKKNSSKKGSEKDPNDSRSVLAREQFKILVDRGLSVPVAYL